MADELLLQEARAFVSEWLFESTDRRSGGMPWHYEHCEDAARMIMQFFKDHTNDKSQQTLSNH